MNNLRTISRVSLALLCYLSMISTASADEIMIVDGNASFRLDSDVNENSGSMDLMVGSDDYGFSSHWFLTDDSTSTTTELRSGAAGVFGPDSADMTYSVADVFVNMRFTVVEVSPGVSAVETVTHIQNFGAAFNGKLAHYHNLQTPGPDFSNSTFLDASDPNSILMGIADGNQLSQMDYHTGRPDRWEIRDYSTNLFGDMASGLDLNSSDNGFAFGDFAGGVEWDLNLAPGDFFLLYQSTHTAASVPEPTSACVMACLALTGLCRRKRRLA